MNLNEKLPAQLRKKAYDALAGLLVNACINLPIEELPEPIRPQVKLLNSFFDGDFGPVIEEFERQSFSSDRWETYLDLENSLRAIQEENKI